MRTCLLNLSRVLTRGMRMANDLAMNVSLLRLFQLVSPALPVGAYAYSQGLEYAVEEQWLTDEAQTQAWLMGLLKNNLTRLDVPVFVRLYAAWEEGDLEKVAYWNRYLFVSREARELQQEEQHLGAALLRLLVQLDVDGALACKKNKSVCFATAFSLAAVRWSIPLRDAATGYLWAWLENQVAAAVKLVPLGQTAGQRILSVGVSEIPLSVTFGMALSDEEVGFMAPSLAMASAAHESQYSRLFQS